MVNLIMFIVGFVIGIIVTFIFFYVFFSKFVLKTNSLAKMVKDFDIPLDLEFYGSDNIEK